ncbi:MAG: hypothetical protein K2X81_05380 [Candidatus Obscuribacterales bacterium]|nr:hypothetical protein [Candidatus Obscuribacterales bacterium]
MERGDSTLSTSNLLIKDHDSSLLQLYKAAYGEATNSIKDLSANITQHPVESVEVAAVTIAGLCLSRNRISGLLGLSASSEKLQARRVYLDSVESQTQSLMNESHQQIGKMLKTAPLVGAFRPNVDVFMDTAENISFYRKYFGEAEGADIGIADRSRAKLASLMIDNKRSVDIGSTTLGGLKGQNIGQGAFGIAPMDCPLSTGGLATCSGLLIQNERAGIHYLAHVDIGVSAEQLKASLKGFPVEESKAFLHPGNVDSPVWDYVLQTLKDINVPMENVQLIRPNPTASGQIVSHANSIYSKAATDIRTWAEFKLADNGGMLEFLK